MERLLQKSELVHMTWKMAQKDVPGLKKAHIEAILDGLIASISDALSEDREVPLGKICTISAKLHPARTIEDKITGKPRQLPARKMLHITTGKPMLAILNAKKPDIPENGQAQKNNDPDKL